MQNVQLALIERLGLKAMCILCLLVGLNGCTLLIIERLQIWQCEKDGGTVIDFRYHYLKTNGELDDT